VAQPEHADEGAPDRRGRVEDRQQRGRQRHRGVAEQQEGQGGIEEAEDQVMLPVRAGVEPAFHELRHPGEEQRRE
jgi:hypothetical protein